MTKHKIITAIAAAAALMQTAANAAVIPSEMISDGADAQSVAITEQLIGGVLDSVIKGEGYAMAKPVADKLIRSAVIENKTNGYGYGVMSAIANNAIRYYRDIYLRPDFYAAEEERVKTLIADIITDVQNGKDYNTAVEQAYTKIYQAADPSYNPAIDRVGDSCYWDVPPVDSASLALARKLLIAAVPIG